MLKTLQVLSPSSNSGRYVVYLSNEKTISVHLSNKDSGISFPPEPDCLLIDFVFEVGQPGKLLYMDRNGRPIRINTHFVEKVVREINY